MAIRRRGTVLLVALTISLVCIDGLRRVRVQDSWLDGFAAAGEFARSARYFDEQFLGAHRLFVALDLEPRSVTGEFPGAALGRYDARIPRPPFDAERLPGSRIRIFQFEPKSPGLAPTRKPREWETWIESVRTDEDAQLVIVMPTSGGSAGNWLRPAPAETLGYEIHYEPLLAPPTLERIGEFEAFLADLGGVGGVLGPAGYLRTVGFMLQPDRPGSRRLPAEPREAKVFWSSYAAVRGAERRDQLVDRNFSRTVVTVFLKGADYVDSARILESIRAYATQHLLPHGVEISIGGDVAVSQALIGAVVETQTRSILLSLVAIVAAAALFARSLRRGIISVVPCAFAVLINFAVMGWVGVPLGVATSMFASMTLGVGVDHAIHLLARQRFLTRSALTDPERNGEPHPVIALASRSVGPAILIDAGAIGIGFGILTLSQVPANARLGGLLALSILSCVGATLVLVPAMIGTALGRRTSA